MAMIKGPFFSTFATGSIGKTLTCNPRFNNNQFVMSSYKSRSGKRHQIQIENAKVFAIRIKAALKTIKILGN